jgi:hypothetical protein
MNEQVIEQLLDQTTGFLQRQQLLKQLWKLRCESAAKTGETTLLKESLQPKRRQTAERVVA